MAEISASMVMKLRKVSGQGMMDCKKALTEADGDVEKAIEILRKKGLATLAKRAGRDTSEGLIVTRDSEDGKVVVLASLCCETDFVSKSDDFGVTAEQLAKYAFACDGDEGIENVLETELDDRKFTDILTETISKTGEKMEIGDYVKYKLDGPGLITTYIHFNKKVGTMIQIEANDDSTADSASIKQAAADIAMHITAINPLSLDKEGIDKAKIEQERKIFADQIKDKPENIQEKIIEGKLNKFYAENCLLNQAFVKDDSKTVARVVEDAAKQAGGKAEISRFVRFAVG